MVNELTPQFTKKQVVRISLYNHQGKVKNALAKKALPYYAQVAEVVKSDLFEIGHKVAIVYWIKADDGTIFQLTEDCLMAVNDMF